MPIYLLRDWVTNEELEVLVHEAGILLLSIHWWNGAHDWKILLEGCKSFKRNRTNSKRGERIALYLKHYHTSTGIVPIQYQGQKPS